LSFIRLDGLCGSDLWVIEYDYSLFFLIPIFRTGCGSNIDLTKDGSAKWLAGIPPEKQQMVYYWTSQGKTACSGPANFIGLDQPNDGNINGKCQRQYSSV
jgi:hypothetical protein